MAKKKKRRVGGILKSGAITVRQTLGNSLDPLLHIEGKTLPPN